MSDEIPEKLQYNMLGDDQSSETDKIAKYTGDVDWSYLKPHFKNEAMIYVDPELTLSDVAEVFVHDDREKVQAWLKTADLVKPSSLHAEWWEYDETRFTAVVISPFVLAQPLPKDKVSTEDNGREES